MGDAQGEVTPLLPRQKLDELITAKSEELLSVKPHPTGLPAVPEIAPEVGDRARIAVARAAVAKAKKLAIVQNSFEGFIEFGFRFFLYWNWLSRTMEPLAVPLLAERETVTVNRELAAQPLKFRVTGTVALAPGARVPAVTGNRELSVGAQAAPPA